MTADGSANGDTPLLERERELAALVEALDQNRVSRGPCWSKGPPGSARAGCWTS
jgi:hypothetical protein